MVFAQLNWPMMFSRFFETVKTSGPDLSTNNIIIAINWTGLFFISEQEQVLVRIIFYHPFDETLSSLNFQTFFFSKIYRI